MTELEKLKAGLEYCYDNKEKPLMNTVYMVGCQYLCNLKVMTRRVSI